MYRHRIIFIIYHLVFGISYFININKRALLTKISQLSDSNRVPARYEGAALPGELSWQLKRTVKAVKQY